MKPTKDTATARGQVRSRLEQIEASLASAHATDERVIDEVYRRRARQLAERPAADVVSTTFGVLVFGLGAERYGLELSALSEVLPYRGCTEVPGTPAALLGVMNVRGDIRAVADLRRILELAPGETGAAGYVVMVRQQDRVIGLRVDTLEEVRQVDPAELVSGDRGARIPGSRFVKALTADTVILIDTHAVLSGLGFELT